MEKANILLTGASGTVGYEVLKQLIQKKDQFNICVFDLNNRKNRQLLSPFKNRVEIVYGDLSKPEQIEKVCNNKDFVIHLAAIIPPLADEFPELAYKVNALGTENLIRNLEAHSPNAFFVYSSSISVYGDRLKTPFIKVGDPLCASEGDEYAKTKLLAEEIIQNSNLNWSIFRLTAIMGNHKMTKLMFHMPLETKLEIATPEDTARAFVNSYYEKQAIEKQIFNLGGGELCRTNYKEFIEQSFKLSGLGALNFPLNSFATKNFHCGYYADGDILNDILHFRKGNLDTLYALLKNKIPKWQYFLTNMFKESIKKAMLKQSEPLAAWNTNNTELKKHFFTT